MMVGHTDRMMDVIIFLLMLILLPILAIGAGLVWGSIIKFGINFFINYMGYA